MGAKNIDFSKLFSGPLDQLGKPKKKKKKSEVYFLVSKSVSKISHILYIYLLHVFFEVTQCDVYNK